MYQTIVTHERPHLDEICAVWLLKKFGQEIFPGIKEAKVIFGGAGGEGYKGVSGDELETEGIIMVGVGAGKFDEHPGVKCFRKEDECASTLVAKALGLESDSGLARILQFVKNSDLKSSAHPFDLAQIVNAMHHAYPNEPGEVMKWAMLALSVKYKEQMDFLKSQKNLGGFKEIKGPKGRTLNLAVGVSDDETFNKAARNNGAAIVIQKNSSGNVQIFTSKKEGIILYDVAQMLRLKEQEAKGNVETADWKDLAKEGKVSGAEEWYFHEPGQMLLNGSLSCPDVAPTKLSLDAIVEIVEIGVNPAAFEPERAQNCQRGECVSTQKNLCPWYKYGLNRCRKIRGQK